MRPVEIVQIVGLVVWFCVMMLVSIRKRTERSLHRAGAFDEPSAIALETVKPWKRWVRARMKESGVIVETADGRFWLDRAKAAEQLKVRRRRGLTAVAIVVVLGALLFVLVQWAR